MMARKQRWFESKKGQAVLEFAVLFPLIIIFIAMIVDFGLAIDRRQVLQHASREGARWAAVHSDLASIQDYTERQGMSFIGPSDVSVCYEDANGSGVVGDPGDAVRVTISHTYDFWFFGPVLSGFFGGSIGTVDISPSGVARLERSVSGATACT